MVGSWLSPSVWVTVDPAGRVLVDTNDGLALAVWCCSNAPTEVILANVRLPITGCSFLPGFLCQRISLRRAAIKYRSRWAGFKSIYVLWRPSDVAKLLLP